MTNQRNPQTPRDQIKRHVVRPSSAPGVSRAQQRRLRGDKGSGPVEGDDHISVAMRVRPYTEKVPEPNRVKFAFL